MAYKHISHLLTKVSKWLTWQFYGDDDNETAPPKVRSPCQYKRFKVKNQNNAPADCACEVPFVLGFFFRPVRAEDASTHSACTYVPGILFDAGVIW